MANVFSNALGGALANHAVALSGNAATTVTYRRGGYSVSLAATKCPVRSDADLQFGVLKIDECDWIIQASLLILNLVTVEPKDLDTITESDGTKWQVMPLAGEQSYRPSDPFKTSYRIHTKKID